MRHSFFRLGLTLVVLAGFCPTAARAQSPDWGTPIDLRSGGVASGDLTPDLITQVQEGTAWERDFPSWYLRGEALFLQRVGVRDRVITVIDNATFETLTDDVPVITADQLQPDNFQSGWRAEVGRAFGSGLAIEGQYFLVDDWFQQAQFTSNGLFVTDPVIPGDALSPPDAPPDFAQFPVDDFYQALQHTVDYRSVLLNSEINLRATWRWCNFVRSQLAGVRFAQLREDFFLVSQDDRLSRPDDGFGLYDIRTKNNLIGAQYGEEIMFQVLGTTTLTINGKVGLYANDIEVRRSITNDGVEVVNLMLTDTNLAFLGELGAHLNVKVTDMVSIRGGYNLYWIEGLALAPEQYTFNQALLTDVNEHGGLFVHGFSLGLEVRR